MIADGGSAIMDHGLISLCGWILSIWRFVVVARSQRCVNTCGDFVPFHACQLLDQQHPGEAEPARRAFVSLRKCCAHARQLSEMRGTASNRSTSSRSRV